MKKNYIVPQTDMVKVEILSVLAASDRFNGNDSTQDITPTDQEYDGTISNKIDYWGSDLWSE
ncbi:MAG: hypothetical protein IJ767_00330 [Bacteroidaceae bacterium]|nr:hypothetical protein [Bacteroidaceae bacterium]